MGCASCVGRLEAALKKVDYVDEVAAWQSNGADTHSNTQRERLILIEAVEKAGYSVQAPPSKQRTLQNFRDKKRCPGGRSRAAFLIWALAA